MSRNWGTFGWFAGGDHPRLAVLALAGVGLGVLGRLLWLTAAPVGHGLGTTGRQLATLGGIIFAFAVFERGFD